MSIRDLAAYRQRLIGIDWEREQVANARDAMLRADYEAGVSIAELSRATGLSRTMLYKILEKDETR